MDHLVWSHLQAGQVEVSTDLNLTLHLPFSLFKGTTTKHALYWHWTLRDVWWSLRYSHSLIPPSHAQTSPELQLPVTSGFKGVSFWIPVLFHIKIDTSIHKKRRASLLLALFCWDFTPWSRNRTWMCSMLYITHSALPSTKSHENEHICSYKFGRHSSFPCFPASATTSLL